jgi:hypothetical protein
MILLKLIGVVLSSTLIMLILFGIMASLDKYTTGKTGIIRSISLGLSEAILPFLSVVFNIFIGSIWFLERPKGAPIWFIEAFSDRLRRHYYHSTKGWRKRLASLFRKPINKIQAGHI